MKAHKYTRGMDIGAIATGLSCAPWDIEPTKSSVIEIIPTSGIITKQKERKLDRTIYETYAAIFMAELLKQWSSAFPKADFTLYAPPALKLEYGEQGNDESRFSKIYEFFCPGLALNKLPKGKAKDFKVQNEEVRVEHRVGYLAGIVNEIFRKEGVIHADPQLRHFFLLPKEGQVYDVTRDGRMQSFDARNGIGVIDCENTRVEGPYSQEVNADADKFKERVIKFFPHKNTEQYFDKGKGIVTATDARFVEAAKNLAYQIFSTRFPQTAKSVDLTTKQVTYR